MAGQESQFIDCQLFVLRGMEPTFYCFAVDLHDRGLVRRTKTCPRAKAKCSEVLDVAIRRRQPWHAGLLQVRHFCADQFHPVRK